MVKQLNNIFCKIVSISKNNGKVPLYPGPSKIINHKGEG